MKKLLEMFNIGRSLQIGSILLSLVVSNTMLTTAPVAAQSNDPTPPAPAQPAAPDPPSPYESTRPSNYIGIGPSFGFGGASTALSTGGLAIFSKRVLTDTLSIHTTAAIFGVSVPSVATDLTLDLPVRDEESGEIVFSPFVGAGIMVWNENSETRISPHLTVGVDLPLLDFTPTIRLDVGFPADRQADIGLIIGVGFSFN